MKETVSVVSSKYFEYKIGISTREITLSYLSNDHFKLDIICWGEWTDKVYKNVYSIRKYLKYCYDLNADQLKEVSKAAYAMQREARKNEVGKNSEKAL